VTGKVLRKATSRSLRKKRIPGASSAEAGSRPDRPATEQSAQLKTR
jgi:hypothetical protein